MTFRRRHRQLSRTGLLEYHYEKFLYGDTCLSELPERPRLHILATNLSEGCLCAFTRDGLVMQRRRPGHRFRFDRIHAGLATLPMAVTASSAFPGFFPPLELQGQDVGADPGQFGQVAFTDGGVYDNLGVRMFKCLEQSWLAREIRLQRGDLADAGQAASALEAAAQSSEDSPLRRLAQMMALSRRETPQPVNLGGESVDRLLHELWDVMNREDLAREPVFARLSPPDPDVEPLLVAAQQGGEIEAGEQLWLNRQLVDAAFRQATGKPCFRSLNVCFDTVLVSDAGKQFKISNARSGGLIARSMRATDIVMDRVWQLETDTFSGTPGFVFAPISKVVEADEDPTAIHPEMQRMAADIRTDLDRFSPLEISALIRHGYCVGRSACRSCPDLFGATTPDSAPWDPLASKSESVTQVVRAALDAHGTAAAPETVQARKLQQSGRRRVWSSLLDYRDWTSFIYVPLLVPILVVLPYYAAKWYHQSQVAQRLIEGMAQSNVDYAVMNKLLQEGPSPSFEGMPVEEVPTLLPPADAGIEVITDTRILDYRPLNVGSGGALADRSWLYLYRRIRLQKQQPTANQFAIQIKLPIARLSVRALNDSIPTSLRLSRDATGVSGQSVQVFEMAFDLSKVPGHEVVDLPIELLLRETPPDLLRSVSFSVDSETALLTGWVVLPEGKQYEDFNLLRYPIGNETGPERVIPANLVNSMNGQILAFSLLSLKPGFRYECRWSYRE